MKITMCPKVPGATYYTLAIIEYQYSNSMRVVDKRSDSGHREIVLAMSDDLLIPLSDAIELVEALQAAIKIAQDHLAEETTQEK